MRKNKCGHIFRIFKDPKLKNTCYLSFYCQKCLKLEKTKKVYENEKK